MTPMSEPGLDDARRVELTELGEELSGLRLHRPESVHAMRLSLERHGQMTAAATYCDTAGRLQVLDGFKRLQAAGELGWTTLTVRVLDVTGTQAKASLDALNRQGGLTELEEGWLVRSLYREDKLSQPEIGRLLGRHKSWVCRRLALVELLDEVVQGDVRLGLVAPRTAMSLARLPRGNQQPAAELVARRGLTTKQTEQLCSSLLDAPSDGQRQSILADWEAGRRGGTSAGAALHRPLRPAELILLDIGQLCRVAARLEARLLAHPRASLSAEAAATVLSTLAGLRPVIDLLQQAAQRGEAMESVS